MFDTRDTDKKIGLTDKSKPPAEGIFTLRYRDDPDQPWAMHTKNKPNLIVDTARKIMAHAISNPDGDYVINHFRLGGSNTLGAGELLEPARPTPSDTNLIYTDNLFVRDIGDVVNSVTAFTHSYPNEPNETSVLFEIYIGRGEANLLDPTATAFTAAGLFVRGGAVMFASQTFPVITKTPNREFLFAWSINF